MLRRLDPLDRRVLALALPALGALVVEPLYNLTDSAIVGHLGSTPLGALAISTAGLNVLGWAAGFLEMATVSAVAFRRSAGDELGAGRATGASYLLSGVGGGLLAVLLELIAPLLVTLLGGHSRAVHADAVLYLRIAAVGMIPLLVALAGSGHLIGLADTRRPFLIALASNVVNVTLEIVFVYVLHLGLAGSAWGTVVAQVTAAGLFVGCSLKARIRPRRPSTAEIRELLRAGVPLTIRTVALGSALLATTAIAARLGTAPLGGHQIAMQVWTMLALTLDALAVPAQVFVSEALGTSDLGAARAIGRRTLRMGVLLGSLIGLLTVALSGVLPRIFSPDAAVQHQAMLALLVCGAQQPLAAGAFVLDGLILGAAEYATMRRAMLLALIAFAPLAVVTIEVPGVGISGVWAAMLCWLAARTLLLGRRWRSLVRGPIAALP
ncbi:MAG TPA: MATE family efflux transporter [Acidimicrobiales bacterium]|nr:MATE family efflux transporter [Acidimicrobiales bacterium]